MWCLLTLSETKRFILNKLCMCGIYLWDKKKRVEIIIAIRDFFEDEEKKDSPPPDFPAAVSGCPSNYRRTEKRNWRCSRMSCALFGFYLFWFAARFKTTATIVAPNSIFCCPVFFTLDGQWIATVSFGRRSYHVNLSVHSLFMALQLDPDCTLAS